MRVDQQKQENNSHPPTLHELETTFVCHRDKGRTAECEHRGPVYRNFPTHWVLHLVTEGDSPTLERVRSIEINAHQFRNIGPA